MPDTAGGHGVWRELWVCFPVRGMSVQGWRSLRELHPWLPAVIPSGDRGTRDTVVDAVSVLLARPSAQRAHTTALHSVTAKPIGAAELPMAARSIATLMKHACAGCKGTGTFTGLFGASSCKGCGGSGYFSHRWLLMICHECGGKGSSTSVLQGERDTPDGGVEFFPKCANFPCHHCKGRGLLPWIPGSTIVRWLYVSLLVPLVGVLALLNRLGRLISFRLGKPQGQQIAPQSFRSIVTDPSSLHQLILRWVPQGSGYDFDSLTWYRPEEGEKQPLESPLVVATITRSAFQAGSERKRWISDVHSFDSTTGHAIIKVAEADVPMDHPPEQEVNFQYTWRQWSIRENREVRYLATCKLPSDEFLNSAA